MSTRDTFAQKFGNNPNVLIQSDRIVVGLGNQNVSPTTIHLNSAGNATEVHIPRQSRGGGIILEASSDIMSRIEKVASNGGAEFYARLANTALGDRTYSTSHSDPKFDLSRERTNKELATNIDRAVASFTDHPMIRDANRTSQSLMNKSQSQITETLEDLKHATKNQLAQNADRIAARTGELIERAFRKAGAALPAAGIALGAGSVAANAAEGNTAEAALDGVGMIPGAGDIIDVTVVAATVIEIGANVGFNHFDPNKETRAMFEAVPTEVTSGMEPALQELVTLKQDVLAAQEAHNEIVGNKTGAALRIASRTSEYRESTNTVAQAESAFEERITSLKESGAFDARENTPERDMNNAIAQIQASKISLGDCGVECTDHTPTETNGHTVAPSDRHQQEQAAAQTRNG